MCPIISGTGSPRLSRIKTVVVIVVNCSDWFLLNIFNQNKLVN